MGGAVAAALSSSSSPCGVHKRDFAANPNVSGGRSSLRTPQAAPPALPRPASTDPARAGVGRGQGMNACSKARSRSSPAPTAKPGAIPSPASPDRASRRSALCSRPRGLRRWTRSLLCGKSWWLLARAGVARRRLDGRLPSDSVCRSSTGRARPRAELGGDIQRRLTCPARTSARGRESLATAFWGRESLFVWAFRSHFRRRREWPDALSQWNVIRLTHPREVDAFLAAATQPLAARSSRSRCPSAR
jgi:hypothetical protein